MLVVVAGVFCLALPSLRWPSSCLDLVGCEAAYVVTHRLDVEVHDVADGLQGHDGGPFLFPGDAPGVVLVLLEEPHVGVVGDGLLVQAPRVAVEDPVVGCAP